MSRIATKFVVLALATFAVIAASPLASGASTIGQGPPTSGTIDVAGSSSYTALLNGAGIHGSRHIHDVATKLRLHDY